MRISPIALTTRIYRNNHANKSDFKNNPILKNEFDTVSFKGKALSYDEVKPYKLEAYKLSDEASSYCDKSASIIKSAYDELKIAKQAFKYTQSALSIANKNPDEHVVGLDNGNILIINPKITTNGRFFTFVETDKHSIPVRDIKYFGHNKFEVTIHNDGYTRDVYSFEDGEISIFKNHKGNMADCMYDFKNGKLMLCLEGIALSDNNAPPDSKEAYLFEDDSLITYTTGLRYDNSDFLCDERFCYKNGVLIQYCRDFKSSANKIQSWSSSYHFKDGKFAVYLDNVKYNRATSDANGSSVIFLNNNGKYIKSSDFLCELTPDGSIDVLDGE